jgi:hypothetical protein
LNGTKQGKKAAQYR